MLISSSAGLAGGGITHDAGAIGYAASKHGMVGLMRVYANLLAPHSIRVNSLHPAGVDTPMINNEFTRNWLAKMAEGLTPVIDSVFPLDEFAKGLEKLESRKAFGKVIVTF